MEEGFVVDVAQLKFIQAHWHSGKPNQQEPFGIDCFQLFKGKSLPNLVVDPHKMHPISARRCEKCGVLKLYAHTSDQGQRSSND